MLMLKKYGFTYVRADALPYEAIALPNERPFILLRHRRGCQVVHDMDVREETIQWDTEDDDNNNHMSGDHPYEDGTGHIRLHFTKRQNGESLYYYVS